MNFNRSAEGQAIAVPVIRLADYRKPTDDDLVGRKLQSRFGRLIHALSPADREFVDSVLRQLEERY